MKKIVSVLLILCSLLLLCSCHGSKGTMLFTLPDEFDESRNYEITFWAKNDTNMTQVEIYKKAISDWKSLFSLKFGSNLFKGWWGVG